MAPKLTRGVHHVAIVVRDLAESERFYIDVLGLPLRVRHFTRSGGHRATWLDLGPSSFLALELAGSAMPMRDVTAPGIHCLALTIDRSERAAWLDRMRDRGIAVVRETSFTFYIEDPDGSLIGLSHHPAPID